MQDVINTATTSFQTTTGFSFSDVVTFVIGLIKQALGLGLGVLQQVWPVLLAFAAIAMTIYLARLGWKFFHPHG